MLTEEYKNNRKCQMPTHVLIYMGILKDAESIRESCSCPARSSAKKSPEVPGEAQDVAVCHQNGCRIEVFI